MKFQKIKKVPDEYCCMEGKFLYCYNSRNNFLTIWTYDKGLQRPFYNYADRFPDQDLLKKLDWKPNFHQIDWNDKKETIWPIFNKEA